jgi:hypothetical protein
MKVQSSFMKDQLVALENDQRPFIELTERISQPILDIRPPFAVGHVLWTAEFINAGKTTATDFVAVPYIATGIGPFELSYLVNSPNSVSKTSVPPGKRNYITAESRRLFSTDEFKQLLTKDSALGILITFDYSDASNTNFLTQSASSDWQPALWQTPIQMIAAHIETKKMACLDGITAIVRNFRRKSNSLSPYLLAR